MATATHIPSAALDETFKRKIFSKEVEGWLGRATPAERERFNSLYESLHRLAESKKPQDPDAAFVHGTMEKIKRSAGSSGTASGGKGVPAAPASSVAAGGEGWTYTATRSALTRPETATAILKLQAQQAQQTQQQQQQQQVAAESERPHSAPGSGSGRDREMSSFDHAAARRRAISFGVPVGASSGDAAAAAAAAASTRPFIGLGADATTYQESYNLRSALPEVYDQALRDTKADPVPNYTLISEWGNSLKAGSDAAHKMYMQTTYNATNDEVVKLRTDAEAVREREYMKWLLRQKVYYADLLTKAKAPEFEAIFAGASDEQKHDLLETLRQVHAVADPDALRSHSQAVHCYMAPLEDAELRAKLRSHTQLRTMGGPLVRMRPSRVGTNASASGQRPGTAVQLKPATQDLTFEGAEGAEGAGSARGGAGGGAKALRPSRRPATAPINAGYMRPTFTTARAEKDTFRSKVPLQWASNTGGPQLSTYIDAFGGGKYAAGRVRPDSGLYRTEPIKPKECTVPFGAVNPHTALAPGRDAYPVPECFLGPAGDLMPPAKAGAGMTTQRAHFPPRASADVDALHRAAVALAEAGKKTAQRTTLPLGPKSGINLVQPSAWISENHDEYIPFEVNPRENAERAAALRTMFQGPTASAGKVATIVEPR